MTQHFTILQCGRNMSAAEVRKNLGSVIRQDYDNFTAVWFDDASDKPHGVDIATEMLEPAGFAFEGDAEVKSEWTTTSFKSYAKGNRRVTLARNEQRQYGMYNYWLIGYAAHEKYKDKGGTVFMYVGADDSLAHPYVLQRFAKVYDDGAWVAWSRCRDMPHGGLGRGKPYPKHIMEQRLYRAWSFEAMHPFTCRSDLFVKVRQGDIMINGRFADSSSDLHFMLPILEMAPPERIGFVDEVLYHYTVGPQNDAAQAFPYQVFMAWHARSKPRYSHLKSLDDAPTFDNSPSDYNFVFRAPASGKPVIELMMDGRPTETR